MKRIGILLALFLCVGLSTYADNGDIIKISMNGEVKRAKEFGGGNGISFILPELTDSGFVVSAIELAVFERRQEGGAWAIYKDAAGGESKKRMIENPTSLHVQADLGTVSDYRENAKYKLAYRYHVQSVSDFSKTMIAGEGIKDGWRLVGEADGTKATDSGFSFYRNAKPAVTVRGLSYQAETITGTQTFLLDTSQLEATWLPSHAFQTGITVDYIAADADTEDYLTVGYKLINAMDDTVIAQGPLGGDGKIICNEAMGPVKLVLTTADQWGAIGESTPVRLQIDHELPEVVSQFNDMGRVLRGRNLFSRFKINDGPGEPLSSGNVYYTVRKDGAAIYQNVRLPNNTNGEYTVDLTGMNDGVYEIELTIFDKSRNKKLHVLRQTLDNTAPTVTFTTPEENPDTTPYSQWVNQSKKIMFTMVDAGAGVRRYTCYIDGSMTRSAGYAVRNQISTSMDVTSTKTGKILYYFFIYDNACTIDKTTNAANTNVDGNQTFISKYVWLDKTAPSVTIHGDKSEWYPAPRTVYADIYDYPSSSSVSDNSGIQYKYYTITDSETPDDNWRIYSDAVTFDTGGVYYLHIKAVDFAGNETVQSKKIKINTPSTITGSVTPTDEYWHTVYNHREGMYIIKNTAYNTKYHFALQDLDINDVIRTDVRLVSQDNSAVYSVVSVDTVFGGSIHRDVVYNMPYTKPDGNPLPDGVYTMYITVSEIKNDGTVLVTHQNIPACEVILKRSSPPDPVIQVAGGAVSIEYPPETLASSLNRSDIKALYKREYKAVIEGQTDSNKYELYSGSIPVADLVVTALYTDPAGNISTATKRIFPEDTEKGSIIIAGSTVTVEESRPATTYFIGVRRDKQAGIDETIFNFME